VKVTDNRLQGVKLIEPTFYEDTRGYFLESYHADRYAENGLPKVFVQDNHSLSKDTGVIRGLHYRLNPAAQSKLVRVSAGAIYDVVVDIRIDSATYGQWEAFELSVNNKLQLFVPAGFAHGFCTLHPHTEVQYKVDSYYSSRYDRGILWNDADIGIVWATANPVLSENDSRHPPLKDAEINFHFSEGSK